MSIVLVRDWVDHAFRYGFCGLSSLRGERPLSFLKDRAESEGRSDRSLVSPHGVVD